MFVHIAEIHVLYVIKLLNLIIQSGFAEIVKKNFRPNVASVEEKIGDQELLVQLDQEKFAIDAVIGLIAPFVEQNYKQIYNNICLYNLLN